MRIVTRAEWGFDGWLNGVAPSTVNEQTERVSFFTHYHGGATGYALGVKVPRSIHAMHKANGWKGIGYGHVVTADGTIYEGRGFTLSGSHCPGHNRTGYSAQVHIGGSEKPTDAQLTAQRWLYEEAQRRAGRTLAKKGHRDGVATSCPGEPLYAWVKAGMPAPKIVTPEPEPTPTPAPVSDATTQEAHVMFLIQQKGLAPVYKSDGFRRIHIDKVARDAFIKAGLKVTVFDTAAEVEAFGPVVTN